jgi:hypothetical protein
MRVQRVAATSVGTVMMMIVALECVDSIQLSQYRVREYGLVKAGDFLTS